MPTIPSNEPVELRAGDTWKWSRTDKVADYPSPTWTLKYRFKNQSGGFEIVATADGAGGFNVSVDKATTAALAAGTYAWQAEVDNGTERYTLELGGVLKVVADFFTGTASAALDQRTHARKMLEAIETALESFGANPVMKSYTIGTRTYMRAEIPDLLVLRDRYRAEVQNEEARAALADGQPNPRIVRMRFGRA
jgi:hypothetical protein